MGKATLKKMNVSELTAVQIKKLEQALKEGAKSLSWNKKGALKEGAKIYGVVLNRKTVASKIGKKKTATDYVQLKTQEGIKGIWLKTVLAEQFRELNITIGDIIAIEYLGKVKNYESYNTVKL